MKYYSLKEIKKRHCLYNVIYGERSNGKTTSVELEGIKNYVETGKQLAIIRRWSEDFTGKRGQQMFDGCVTTDEFKKIVKNTEWTDVFYFSSRWYLCRYEDGKRVQDSTPFAYGFSLSAMEHDKSTSYPDVTTIMFDEFISRKAYLPDEFVLFMNTLSTIIRTRDDVTIYMLGNSVNKYCPYFVEMGIDKRIRTQKIGTIDVYTYGDSGLSVAVEYAVPTIGGKKSDKYFAFDNSRLQMITQGGWEIDVYPHFPREYKIKPSDTLFSYFIEFGGDMLQCDIIDGGNSIFTFIHRKTGELKNPDSDLIFSTSCDPRPNHRRNLLKPLLPVENKIYKMFKEDKIFYQDNEVGEIVRNYLIWCKGGN